MTPMNDADREAFEAWWLAKTPPVLTDKVFTRCTWLAGAAHASRPGEPVAWGPGMFRKKPVVIRAVQFNAPGDHPAVIATPDSPTGFGIMTLEHTKVAHEVTLGDWIITGVKGEVYACKPDIFAATYEPAHAHLAPPAPVAVPVHMSDCALHNGPATMPKPCDCGADPGMTPERYGSEFPMPPVAVPEGFKLAYVPDYPEGNVTGPCICGSWPGGPCLRCPVSNPPAAPSPASPEKGTERMREALEKALGALDQASRRMGIVADRVSLADRDDLLNWASEITALSAAIKALASLPTEPEGETFPYQKTFDAIAAATSICGGHVSISVQAFREAFGSSPHPTAPKPAEVSVKGLEEMHAAGWSVAVHNDYRLQGEPHTFWLWTHPSGRWIKGEGRTDAEALAQCLASLPAEPEGEEPDDAKVYAYQNPTISSEGQLYPPHPTAPKPAEVSVKGLEWSSDEDHIWPDGIFAKSAIGSYRIKQGHPFGCYTLEGPGIDGAYNQLAKAKEAAQRHLDEVALSLLEPPPAPAAGEFRRGAGWMRERCASAVYYNAGKTPDGLAEAIRAIPLTSGEG